MTLYSNKLDFDWGNGSPGEGFPVNSFSVRWTRKASFDAGTYRFRLLAGSGARLLIDNVVVLDAWNQTSVVEHSVDVTLTRGTHKIVVEYFHRRDKARVYLKLKNFRQAPSPPWHS